MNFNFCHFVCLILIIIKISFAQGFTHPEHFFALINICEKSTASNLPESATLSVFKQE